MTMTPYRDLLLWLADMRHLGTDLSADRATAAVLKVLAAYDRDQRLATRWEERFANARSDNFPFGISLTYRHLLRTYFTE
jgi:hypothetical protein